jgi:hypothetical protein
MQFANAIGRYRAPGAVPLPAPTPTPGPGVAQITSLASFIQPAATQRFYLPTADRAGTWAKGSGGNAADFTQDTATGIYSPTANLGDGTVQIVKTLPLVFTPADGSGSVTQTVTITLTTIAAPASASVSYNSDFTGTAGRALHTLPGWAFYGPSPGQSEPTTDGTGKIVGSDAYDANGGANAVLYDPGVSLGGSSIKFRVRAATGAGQVHIAFAASGADNFAYILFQDSPTQLANNANGVKFKQAGTFGGNLTSPYAPNGVNHRADGTTDVTIDISPDGNTATLNIFGVTTGTGTMDLTGKTKGALFGVATHGAYDPAITANASIDSISFVKASTVLAVTTSPLAALGNAATFTLSWSGLKPVAMQGRLKNDTTGTYTTWMTLDSTITGTTSGTISAVITSPDGAPYVAEFRPLNDTPSVAVSSSATYFLRNQPNVIGYNQPGPSYFTPSNYLVNWGKFVDLRDDGRAAFMQSGINGTHTIDTGPNTATIAIDLPSQNTNVTILSTNAATGIHRVQITGDADPSLVTRDFVWTGTKPTRFTVSTDGVTGIINALGRDGMYGKFFRNLDMGLTNGVPYTGNSFVPAYDDNYYLSTYTGSNIPVRSQADRVSARMAVDPTWQGVYDVIPCDLSDADVTARFTVWRDYLPTNAIIITEFGNERWNAKFSGTTRIPLDGIKNGYYGNATALAPNVPISPNFIPYIDSGKVGPAAASGSYLFTNVSGVGNAVWQALRNVTAGALVVEGADWTRRMDMDTTVAGQRWTSIRYNQMIEIMRTVFGETRFQAQISPAMMGQYGDALDTQLAVELNYATGIYDKIKRVGSGWYFTHTGGYNVTTATAANLEADLRANMPATKANIILAVTSVLKMGKIWTGYEGGKHPNFEAYGDASNTYYKPAWDTFFASAAGSSFLTDMGSFIKSLPGLWMFFEQISAQPFTLQKNYQDTTNPMLVGWLAGLAL